MKYQISYKFWDTEKTVSSTRYAENVKGLKGLKAILNTVLQQHLRLGASVIETIDINTLRAKDLTNEIVVFYDIEKYCADVCVKRIKS